MTPPPHNMQAQGLHAGAANAIGSMMSPKQYKAAIQKLGLSQRKAAPFFGLSLRTVQNYGSGKTPIPEPTARLIRLIINLRLDLDRTHRLMAD